MSISGVSAVKSVSAERMTKQEPMDAISKSIENEISDVQRQRQQVSKQDLSADEKLKKRQELQQEISRLNNQLRQRQAEARREQNKEKMVKERDAENVKTDDEKRHRLQPLKRTKRRKRKLKEKLWKCRMQKRKGLMNRRLFRQKRLFPKADCRTWLCQVYETT